MENREPLLVLDQVTRVYGEGDTAVHALRGIDLAVPRGAFLMINGPSGSGKSTLLNLIGFLDRPTGGSIRFGGETIATDDFDTLADFRSRSIGFIFQNFNLIPVLTARENVMVPLLIRSDLTRAEKEARVDAMIEAVGLADRAHQRPDQLSGGQKQRVSIARAMAARTPLVLADEPTASLDSENSFRILELMKTMSETEGVSFIFSTHDPRVEKYAVQRVHLVDGRITEREGI